MIALTAGVTGLGPRSLLARATDRSDTRRLPTAEAQCVLDGLLLPCDVLLEARGDPAMEGAASGVSRRISR